MTDDELKVYAQRFKRQKQNQQDYILRKSMLPKKHTRNRTIRQRNGYLPRHNKPSGLQSRWPTPQQFLFKDKRCLYGD